MPGKKRAADESAEEGEEGCDAAPLDVELGFSASAQATREGGWVGSSVPPSTPTGNANVLEEGCDAAPLEGVPSEEVPYAAANLMIPPGGENPVSNMDQMLQVSESLMQPGGQRALEEAVAGEGDEGGARGSLSPRKG